MSLKYLLFLSFIAVLSSSSNGNRCAIDRAYSYRVCSALASFFTSSRQCDRSELNRLKQRVAFLQGVLQAVARERNAEKTRIAAKKRCQNGKEYQEHCYFLLDDLGTTSMRSYEEAKSACRDEQATLATMGNETVYNFLYNFVKENARDFVKNARNLVLVWTGASYTNGQILLENNRTSGFSRWSPYHPLNDTERNKIAVAVTTNSHTNGGMFDTIPGTKLYPLCRKKISS